MDSFVRAHVAPPYRPRLMLLLALVALACGCRGRYFDLTVNATACNIDACPTIRFDSPSDTWIATRPVTSEFTWPVDTFHYYPESQEETVAVTVKVMCLDDGGCPTCFGEGSSVTFDPLTVDMSPYGN